MLKMTVRKESRRYGVTERPRCQWCGRVLTDTRYPYCEEVCEAEYLMWSHCYEQDLEPQQARFPKGV